MSNKDAVCVYCGDAAELVTSEVVPDGTLYPGVQMMCLDHGGCLHRIHVQFHQALDCPDCEHCRAMRMTVMTIDHRL